MTGLESGYGYVSLQNKDNLICGEGGTESLFVPLPTSFGKCATSRYKFWQRLSIYSFLCLWTLTLFLFFPSSCFSVVLFCMFRDQHIKLKNKSNQIKNRACCCSSSSSIFWLVIVNNRNPFRFTSVKLRLDKNSSSDLLEQNCRLVLVVQIHDPEPGPAPPEYSGPQLEDSFSRHYEVTYDMDIGWRIYASSSSSSNSFVTVNLHPPNKYPVPWSISASICQFAGHLPSVWAHQIPQPMTQMSLIIYQFCPAI